MFQRSTDNFRSITRSRQRSASPLPQQAIANDRKQQPSGTRILSSYVDTLPTLENVDIKWLKNHLEEQRNVDDRTSKIAYEHLKDVMKDKLLRKNFRQLLSSKKIKKHVNTKVLKKREIKGKYKRVDDLQNALVLGPLVGEVDHRQDISSYSSMKSLVIDKNAFYMGDGSGSVPMFMNQLTAASPGKPDNQTPIIFMVDNQIMLNQGAFSHVSKEAQDKLIALVDNCLTNEEVFMGRARKAVIYVKSQNSQINCILPLSQILYPGFANAEERDQIEEVESILPRQFDCPIMAIYGKQFGGSEAYTLMKYSKENIDHPLPAGNYSLSQGEITYAGMQNLLQAMNNVVPFDNDSSFLDLGSGIGMPVFHAALKMGVSAYGIEVCDLHVDNAVLLKNKLGRYGYFRDYKGTIDFRCQNMDSVRNFRASHIYSFNSRFNAQNIADAIRIFEGDADYAPQVLVFQKDPATAKKFGLVNAKYEGQFKITMAGGNSSFTLYVYKKEIVPLSYVESIYDQLLPILQDERFELYIDKVKLDKDDFKRITTQGWLNDSIIDAFALMVFDTYVMLEVFYLEITKFQLIERYIGQIHRGVATIRNNMKKSTILLIPMNVRSSGKQAAPDHWVLFYIDIRDKKKLKGLLIDSLSRSGPYEEAVNSVIQVVKELTGMELTTASITKLENRPLQTNSSDCGLIVCMHLYWYSRFRQVEAFEKKDYWNEERAIYFRKLMACQLATFDMFFHSQVIKAEIETLKQSLMNCVSTQPVTEVSKPSRKL